MPGERKGSFLVQSGGSRRGLAAAGASREPPLSGKAMGEEMEAISARDAEPGAEVGRLQRG